MIKVRITNVATGAVVLEEPATPETALAHVMAAAARAPEHPLRVEFVEGGVVIDSLGVAYPPERP